MLRIRSLHTGGDLLITAALLAPKRQDMKLKPSMIWLGTLDDVIEYTK